MGSDCKSVQVKSQESPLYSFSLHFVSQPQHQQDIVCVCVNIFLRICLRVRVFDLDIVCVAVFVKILSRPC